MSEEIKEPLESEDESNNRDPEILEFYRPKPDGNVEVVVIKEGKIIFQGDDRRKPESKDTLAEKIHELNESEAHVEKAMFNPWSVTLRNISGVIASLSVCAVSLWYTHITQLSIKSGQGWPDNMTLLIVNVGPILIAWSMVNVNKTISAIFGVKDHLTTFKEKMGWKSN